MPQYVDGFLLPILKKNLPAYKKMAAEGAKVWKKFGALDYKECVAEDMKAGGATSLFPVMVGLKAGETVVFSYIVFKSRAHRDQVNKRVMDYFSKKYEKKNMKMPFDMKRMAYGGFNVLVK